MKTHKSNIFFIIITVAKTCKNDFWVIAFENDRRSPVTFLNARLDLNLWRLGNSNNTNYNDFHTTRITDNILDTGDIIDSVEYYLDKCI